MKSERKHKHFICKWSREIDVEANVNNQSKSSYDGIKFRFKNDINVFTNKTF